MRRTCFRCDWSGDTRTDACPSCGARFYVAPPPPALPKRERRSQPAPPEVVAGQAVEPEVGRARGRPVVALVLAASLAMGAVLWFFGEFTRTITPASAPLRGSLLYAVVGEDGNARLYRWDLESGKVIPGPRVIRPLELVQSTAVYPGWVGVTERLPDGRVRASILRYLEADEHPEWIITGDELSWGPLAHSVVTLNRGPLEAGCRDVSIVLVDLFLRRHERQYQEAHLCGDIASLGRDSTTTYFTRVEGTSVEIDFVGYRIRHLVLPNHALIAVSPASDLLVTGSLAALYTDITGGEVRGTALFWRGNQRVPPISYGTAAGPLVVSAVLGWSPDNDQAAVQGSVGAVSGLFTIKAGPGEGERAPRLLLETIGPAWASYADDGSIYVETGGSFVAFVDGRAVELQLPEDAPVPNGPVAWLR